MNNRSFTLAFSGGGFRAMFYCLGGYRRLVELGINQNVSKISSVSGGSIVAGYIMTSLSDGNFKDIGDFDKRVTFPLKRLGQSGFRNKLLWTALVPISLNFWKDIRPRLPRTRLSRFFPLLLDKELFHGKKIIDLPPVPEWSCNTCCLNTGKRFRFKQSDMYGYKIGKSHNIEDITVATAVAASAAFPIMFAPIEFENKGRQYIDEFGHAFYDPPPDNLYFTDGGVYDNLGSENLLRSQDPVIIMDASACIEAWPRTDSPYYYKLNKRVLQISLDQIVLLRRRLVFREGNGIQLLLERPINDIAISETTRRPLARALPKYPSDFQEVEKLVGQLRTDLDAFHDYEIDLLLWAGSSRMDLAIKALVPEIVPLSEFYQIPKSPEMPINKAIEILTKGKCIKKIGVLHSNLHAGLKSSQTGT